MTHTPGPWTVDYVIDGGYQVSGTEEGDHVVIAHRNDVPMRHAEFCANARLIAAAPDLLEALRGLVAVIEADDLMPPSLSYFRQAKAALAQAAGKAAPHA